LNKDRGTAYAEKIPMQGQKRKPSKMRGLEDFNDIETNQ